MNSKIIQKGNAFLLEVNGEALPLYGYLTYQPEKGCYEDFRQIGVNLFFCTAYAGDRGINQYSGIRPFRAGFWKGYGQYDFSMVDEDLKTVVGNARPGEIFIIIRLMVEVPSWWEELNPGEVCLDAHGTPLHQSFCSQKWLDDTEIMLNDFAQWLRQAGWMQYVVGWHMAAGNTEEFIRPFHRVGQMSDYSLPAQTAFQHWSAARYGGDLSALNHAWHRHYRSFGDIRIPSPAQRLYAVNGDLRSEAYEKETIDYYTFLSEAQAKAVIAICAAAKRATAHEFVIGAFYGYLVCGIEGGQHAASIVFESPEVDFIASPFVYTESRRPDIDWQFQGSVASAALHKKPWFAEADVRTHLSRPISQSMPKADPYVGRAYDGPVWYGPETIEASIGQMEKAFSRVLTHSTAIWWFDMWGGWYHDPEYMRVHQKMYEIYKRQMLNGGSENRGEIAVFMDNEAFLRLKSGSALSSLISSFFWKALGSIGTPYCLYMLEDLPLVDPKRYKMAIFVSAEWNKACTLELEKWKNADRLLAFLGVCEVQPLVKMGIVRHELPGTEQLPENQMCGPVQTSVVRWNAEPDDVVLDADEQGVKALLRRFDDYSVYVDCAFVPDAARIHDLANAAGVHLYTSCGDIAYANEDYIAIHAAASGIKRVFIPGKARLTDALQGCELPGNESYVDVKMEKGQTLLMKCTR